MMTQFLKRNLCRGMLIYRHEKFIPPSPNGSSLKILENIFLSNENS